MLGRWSSYIRRAPLAFSVAYGGAKTIAADIVVQKYHEGRETLDWRRSAVFLGFGFFQVGFVQYMVYSKFFPHIFKGAGTFSQQTVSQMLRDTQGLKNVVKQVTCDMLVYHPFCYFPVFYTCQEIINGNMHSPLKTVHDAIQKYIPNAVADWKALWAIFIPVSFFQNSFCPVHLRVPCVATAGFFYCIILSMTRGDEINKAPNTAERSQTTPDKEFETRLRTIRSRYSDGKEGVGMDEFTGIMVDLGLGKKASEALFNAFDDSEGQFPRGSGVVDVRRLLDGLELMASQRFPEELVRVLSDDPRSLPDQVPPVLPRQLLA